MQPREERRILRQPSVDLKHQFQLRHDCVGSAREVRLFYFGGNAAVVAQERNRASAVFITDSLVTLRSSSHLVMLYPDAADSSYVCVRLPI